MSHWTVGELAKVTGVSVRTLHHYESLGLLSPGRRRSGYREYSAGDVGRLQMIVSLKALGLTLREIREQLQRSDGSLIEVIEEQVRRLRDRIETTRALCERLEWLAGRMRSNETVAAEDFIQTMEMMTMFEKYYTPEQLRELDERAKVVGKERISEVESEWPRLMEEVGVEMERGTDPSDERVQALARRWSGLVREFTGGNPETEASLRRMYESESNVAGLGTGPMRKMGEYIGRALESGGS